MLEFWIAPASADCNLTTLLAALKSGNKVSLKCFEPENRLGIGQEA